MLSEYTNEIEELRATNPHFDAIIQKHAELDQKAKDADEGRLYLSDMELAEIKKEKLALKDKALAMIKEYINSKKS